jgi:Sigma-54 interaction domain
LTRLQAKLLRAIQERVIDRVGGTKPVPVDIRIIATSNRNLAEAVREASSARICCFPASPGQSALNPDAFTIGSHSLASAF